MPQEAKRREEEARQAEREEEESRRVQARAREQVEKIKTANLDSKEFWEGRISLLFGRDFQGRPLTGRVEWELDESNEEQDRSSAEAQKGTDKFWKQHP